MTEKLYDIDPYRAAFSATVLSCAPAEESGRWQVLLDRTLFFPEEGGQEPDRGTLTRSSSGDEQALQTIPFESAENQMGSSAGHVQSAPVLPAGRDRSAPLFSVSDVQLRDDVIVHIIQSPDPPFSVGDRVCGRIDWAHRFDQMQQHTGEHIFSGLVHRRFGYDNVGFHLSQNVVTMDYNGELTPTQVLALEAAANRAIWENHPVTACYPDVETLAGMDYRSKSGIQGAVRIVAIEDIDVCACCAPHVRSTAEVGILKVVSAIRYKGGMRLTILCGQRAFADYRARQTMMEGVSHLLSAPQDRLTEAVAQLKAERDALQEAVHRLQEEQLLAKIDALPAAAGNAVLFAEDIDAIRMRHAVNRMTQAHPGFCGLFCGNDADGYQYIIGSRTRDSREMGVLLKDAFGARGGGKPEMIQGYVKAGKSALTKLFTEGGSGV